MLHNLVMVMVLIVLLGLSAFFFRIGNGTDGDKQAEAPSTFRSDAAAGGHGRKNS